MAPDVAAAKCKKDASGMFCNMAGHQNKIADHGTDPVPPYFSLCFWRTAAFQG